MFRHRTRRTRIATRLVMGLAVGLAGVTVVAGSAHAVANQPGAFQAVVSVASTPDHTTALGDGGAYSSAGTLSVGRYGVGDYWVKARGIKALKGNAHLTLFQADAPNFCTVAGVTQLSDGTRVRVRCFDLAGHRVEVSGVMVWFNSFRFTNADPATSYFSLTSSSTGSHTPATQHRANAGPAARVTRTGTGRYTVRLRDAHWGPGDGTVIATARATIARSCSVAQWMPDGADLVIGVRCFRAGGTLADSRFSLVATLFNHLDTATAPGGSQWVDAYAGMPATVLTAYGYNPSGPNGAKQIVPGVFGTRFPGSAGASGLVLTLLLGSYGTAATHCYVVEINEHVDSLDVMTGCVDASGTVVVAPFTVMAGRIYFGD